MNNHLFPIFDWLYERGWLSKRGTVIRDYFVILAVGFVISFPFIVLEVVVNWMVNGGLD